MTPDIFNGLFECLGSLFVAMSCLRLYHDKQVKGVSISHAAFFTAWGFWNLVFYPSVGAWWSFYGGVGVTVFNSLWIGMMLYYKGR
jgi:uncharacterized membrane protein YfcA